MQTVYSSAKPGVPADARIVAAVGGVSVDRLRRVVETISQPRHFDLQPARNRWTADWIAAELADCGLDVQLQGPYRNVVAFPKGEGRGNQRPYGPSHRNVVAVRGSRGGEQNANGTSPRGVADPTPGSPGGCSLLVGAHYDSVPGTPGADDNASAVAALLECARVISAAAPELPVCYVAFNREEDGLIGSADFVGGYLPSSPHRIAAAHILEMVGYCSREPGSQQVPQGLPIQVPSVGDFIGVLGNGSSGAIVDESVACARTYTPDLPAIGLKVMFGAERLLPVLSRSDHDPFWRAGIPAVMWTDTAEFRNPHYHAATDTPDTLDYGFLTRVTQMLAACLLARSFG
jgi:hypothetical protein